MTDRHELAGRHVAFFSWRDTHNPEGKDAAILKIVNGQYVFQEKYAAR